MKFSKAFGLNQDQSQLDFIDIDTSLDMHLYIDPYAIQTKENDFNLQCTDQIKSFFDEVLDALRKKKMDLARDLTSYLSEPKETFLGVSKGKPQGRGVGRGQADQILLALRSSRAFQTGLLSDLAETELFIEGIGPDKISDLTTNVIRASLVEYTKHQCDLHNIETQQVASSPLWNASRREWRLEYVDLPVVAGKPVLLVPKYIVRWKLSLNSQEFYNHYMLSFLRDVHLRANDGLVRVLKKSKERVVYKKDLREKYPLIKDDLAKFAQENPQVLESYKRLKGASGTLTNADFDEKFDEVKFAKALAEALNAMPSGMRQASKYHKFMIGALTFIFFPDLINPIKEHEIHDGRKRIDIKFTNAAADGFFQKMAELAQTRAIDVFFECKNYSKDLGNPELDQITGRFSNLRGKLGFITCRRLENEALMHKRCRDTARDDRGCVIVLTDDKILQFLGLIAELKREEISAHLFKEFANLTK